MKPGGAAVSDGALLVGVGAAAVVLALVWLWGGIAGALFGAGWPRVGLPQLATVVFHLPGDWLIPPGPGPGTCRALFPARRASMAPSLSSWPAPA